PHSCHVPSCNTHALLSLQYRRSHIISVFSSRRPPRLFPLFPYTTLFRSASRHRRGDDAEVDAHHHHRALRLVQRLDRRQRARLRSEEHTSELQSRSEIVCRLLLEKKKTSLVMLDCVALRVRSGSRRLLSR